ncbi:MAG: CdaR family protein [bacterium]
MNQPVKKFPKDWQLKIYMLLLAILLWTFVVTNQVYEVVLEVTLDIVNMKPDKVLVSDVPQSIPIRFSGVGKDLLILKYIQPARIELDIHTINYFYDYPLRTAFVSIPPGLDVQPIAIVGQDTMNIRLEDVLERILPVRPIVDALPALGYMISGNVRTTPDSVTVFGPQSSVRRLRIVQTDTARFQGLDKTTQDNIQLAPLGSNIRITPSSVRVTIPIDKIAERRMPRISLKAQGTPLGREVLMEPSTVDVTLGGPAKRLATMTSDSIIAFVDLYNWNPEEREYPVSLKLPLGIETVETEPERIRIRLEQVDAANSDSLASEGPW